MPLPVPQQKEDKDTFTKRCHRTLSEEYTDSDQRHAICMRQWRKAKAEALAELIIKDLKGA